MTDLVQRLRNRIHDSNMPTEHLLDDAADTLEARDAEIALLNIMLDSNLKQVIESMSNEKYQLTIERDKYKALCDQMAEALAIYGLRYDDPAVDAALDKYMEMK